MENINIEAIVASKVNNIQTKLSLGYKLVGNETLTLTEAKAAIKEIVEAVINKCTEKSFNTCDDSEFYDAVKVGAFKTAKNKARAERMKGRKLSFSHRKAISDGHKLKSIKHETQSNI